MAARLRAAPRLAAAARRLRHRRSAPARIGPRRRPASSARDRQVAARCPAAARLLGGLAEGQRRLLEGRPAARRGWPALAGRACRRGASVPPRVVIGRQVAEHKPCVCGRGPGLPPRPKHAGPGAAPTLGPRLDASVLHVRAIEPPPIPKESSSTDGWSTGTPAASTESRSTGPPIDEDPDVGAGATHVRGDGIA